MSRAGSRVLLSCWARPGSRGVARGCHRRRLGLRLGGRLPGPRRSGLDARPRRPTGRSDSRRYGAATYCVGRSMEPAARNQAARVSGEDLVCLSRSTARPRGRPCRRLAWWSWYVGRCCALSPRCRGSRRSRPMRWQASRHDLAYDVFLAPRLRTKCRLRQLQHRRHAPRTPGEPTYAGTTGARWRPLCPWSSQPRSRPRPEACGPGRGVHRGV